VPSDTVQEDGSTVTLPPRDEDQQAPVDVPEQMPADTGTDTETTPAPPPPTPAPVAGEPGSTTTPAPPPPLP
jgi:hypothetical protein